MQPFDGTFLDVENVVNGDSVDPRLQLAAKIELREPRDRTNEDFLRRILGVLAIPEHAEREAIDVALELPDKTVKGISIAGKGASRDVFERHRLFGHSSMSDFSVASSDVNATRCTSRAPSTCSSATGGAWSTKL